jgi:phytoene desaturase
MSSPLGQVRAAVIGGGFGGLAAAIRLQAAGVRTVLLEARDQPGGRAYVYRDRGFTFDGGPTVITAPHCLEELFEAAGRKLGDYVELLPVQPYYRLLWPDGSALDYDGDARSMCEQIRRRNPADADGYLRFVEYSRQVFEAGYEKLAATPFLRFTDMVRAAPALMRLRADRTVYQAVSRFVRDEQVRQALSFHSLLVGGNPFDTSAIYTLIPHLERKWGVSFPRGGMGALVAALARVFQELGGELRLCSPVRRIEVEERGGRAVHRVSSDAAPREPFDLVVANADVHHTYAELYAGHPGARRRARRLARLDWSMSLFVLYFGTDRPYRGDVLQHTVLFGPRYRELLEEIFRGSRLPPDQSLYLHAPTQTDPSLAPPGCGSFYVLSPVPHLGNAALDWDAIGEAYAERLLGALERWLPDLRRHVVTRLWITPKTFATELRSYQGSAFSCAPTLLQSAYFRPHNRDPDIPGLYLVGAGTHPGAGIPGVVNSAAATARLILSDWTARR